MACGMSFESLKPHLLPVHSLCFDVGSWAHISPRRQETLSTQDSLSKVKNGKPVLPSNKLEIGSD